MEALVSRHEGTAIVKDVRTEIDKLLRDLYGEPGAAEEGGKGGGGGGGGKPRPRVRGAARKGARQEVRCKLRVERLPAIMTVVFAIMTAVKDHDTIV